MPSLAPLRRLRVHTVPVLKIVPILGQIGASRVDLDDPDEH